MTPYQPIRGQDHLTNERPGPDDPLLTQHPVLSFQMRMSLRSIVEHYTLYAFPDVPSPFLLFLLLLALSDGLFCEALIDLTGHQSAMMECKLYFFFISLISDECVAPELANGEVTGSGDER